MNTNMLVVLGLTAGESGMAEKLCDWMSLLSGKLENRHILICSDANVHEEVRVKTRISAESAFETVDTFLADPISSDSEIVRMNHLFKGVSSHILNNYKSPWIWIEPDCVPIVSNWVDALETAYESQCKRFLGSHMKFIGTENVSLSKVAVYPVGAYRDIAPYCDGSTLFNKLAAKELVSKSTKTLLIQQMDYNHETDFGKIRPSSVLLCADKSGELIKSYRAQNQKPKQEPVVEAEKIQQSRSGWFTQKVALLNSK